MGFGIHCRTTENFNPLSSSNERVTTIRAPFWVSSFCLPLSPWYKLKWDKLTILLNHCSEFKLASAQLYYNSSFYCWIADAFVHFTMCFHPKPNFPLVVTTSAVIQFFLYRYLSIQLSTPTSQYLIAYLYISYDTHPCLEIHTEGAVDF